MLLCLFAASSACTSLPTPSSSDESAEAVEPSAAVESSEPGEPTESSFSQTSAAAARYSAGVELPEGPGREILVTECLNCHELRSLELFSSFYDRDNWRSLVISMRSNGAIVDDAELELVADYLALHFGTGTR